MKRADARAPWRRPGAIWAGAFALILVAVIAGRWSLREPDLHGQPLSYWVLPWRHARTENADSVTAAHAAMEKRHVRWLRQQLHWRPNPARKVLGDLISKIGPSVSFETQNDYREFAAAALGRLGDRALPALPDLMANRNTTVEPRSRQAQVAARAALIQLGRAPAGPVLAVVRDPTHPDWFMASDVLARAGTNRTESAQLFATLLRGTNPPGIRTRALELYGYLQPPRAEAISNFCQALLDPATREVALGQLIRLGPSASPPERPPGLSLALNDPNWRVRRLATNFLDRLPSAQTLPSNAVSRTQENP